MTGAFFLARFFSASRREKLRTAKTARERYRRGRERVRSPVSYNARRFCIFQILPRRERERKKLGKRKKEKNAPYPIMPFNVTALGDAENILKMADSPLARLTAISMSAAAAAAANAQTDAASHAMRYLIHCFRALALARGDASRASRGNGNFAQRARNYH